MTVAMTLLKRMPKTPLQHSPSSRCLTKEPGGIYQQRLENNSLRYTSNSPLRRYSHPSRYIFLDRVSSPVSPGRIRQLQKKRGHRSLSCLSCLSFLGKYTA